VSHGLVACALGKIVQSGNHTPALGSARIPKQVGSRKLGSEQVLRVVQMTKYLISRRWRYVRKKRVLAQTTNGRIELAHLATFATGTGQIVFDAVDADPAAALAPVVQNQIKARSPANPHLTLAGAAVEAQRRCLPKKRTQAETAPVVTANAATSALADLRSFGRLLPAAAAHVRRHPSQVSDHTSLDYG